MPKNLLLAVLLFFIGPQISAAGKAQVDNIEIQSVVKRTAKTARNAVLHTMGAALQLGILLDSPDEADGFRRRRRRHGGLNDNDDQYHHDDRGRGSSCKSDDKTCIIASSVVACVVVAAFAGFVWFFMRDQPADCSDCCCSCDCSGCSLPNCSDCLPPAPGCCKNQPNKMTVIKALALGLPCLPFLKSDFPRVNWLYGGWRSSFQGKNLVEYYLNHPELLSQRWTVNLETSPHQIPVKCRRPEDARVIDMGPGEYHGDESAPGRDHDDEAAPVLVSGAIHASSGRCYFEIEKGGQIWKLMASMTAKPKDSERGPQIVLKARGRCYASGVNGFETSRGFIATSVPDRRQVPNAAPPPEPSCPTAVIAIPYGAPPAYEANAEPDAKEIEI